METEGQRGGERKDGYIQEKKKEGQEEKRQEERGRMDTLRVKRRKKKEVNRKTEGKK